MTKQTMLNTAIEIAVEAHSGSYDRGGNPYIMHPIAVMQLLGDCDEELKCIAMLHDVIEDNDHFSLQFMEKCGMSQRVLDALALLTRTDDQKYESYIEGILQNRDAMKVKRADLRHNSDINRLKGVRPKDLERIEKYHRFFLRINEELNK